MEKIRGLFVSAEQVLKHAIRSGQILADKTTVTSRLNICRACEFLENSKCKHCGCFVALKG